MSRQDGIKPHIVGHRGAGNCAPGSTMHAFNKAADMGLEWVEFDVRITRDNHLVVANADNLQSCSGVDINISQSTMEELADINVAQSFSGADGVHKIPLFEDVLRFCKERGIRTQIELKGENNTEDTLAKGVAEVLNKEEFAFAEGKEPLITSFVPECLTAVNQYSDKKLETGLLIHTAKSDDWQELADQVKPTYVHLYGGQMDDGSYLTQEFAPSVKNRGYKLNGYKVNTVDAARAAIDAGVERFTSDEPQTLLEAA